jgi:hypothetical protein
VLSGACVIIRPVSASLLLEDDLCDLSCDVDSYGVYALRIDVEGKKKHMSSTDHRCHNGAIEWKGRNWQRYPTSRAKCVPMIRSE